MRGRGGPAQGSPPLQSGSWVLTLVASPERTGGRGHVHLNAPGGAAPAPRFLAVASSLPVSSTLRRCSQRSGSRLPPAGRAALPEPRHAGSYTRSRSSPLAPAAIGPAVASRYRSITLRFLQVHRIELRAAVIGPRPATTTGTGGRQRPAAVPLPVGRPGVTRHQDQAAECCAPGIRPGTEWAAFYQALSEAFGPSIDALGPNFGDEALRARRPTRPRWPPSSAAGTGTCGPRPMTYGASRCTTRPRSTRTCCCSAAETSTPC